LKDKEKFNLGFSPFCKYLFLFGQIKKFMVFQFLDMDLACSTNKKWVSLEYLVNSVVLMTDNKGKIKFLAVTWL